MKRAREIERQRAGNRGATAPHLASHHREEEGEADSDGDRHHPRNRPKNWRTNDYRVEERGRGATEGEQRGKAREVRGGQKTRTLSRQPTESKKDKLKAPPASTTERRARSHSAGARRRREKGSPPPKQGQHTTDWKRGKGSPPGERGQTVGEQGGSGSFSEYEVIEMLRHLQHKDHRSSSPPRSQRRRRTGDVTRGGWKLRVARRRIERGRRRRRQQLHHRDYLTTSISRLSASTAADPCGRLGHWKDACDVGMMCYKCKKPRHKASECKATFVRGVWRRGGRSDRGEKRDDGLGRKTEAERRMEGTRVRGEGTRRREVIVRMKTTEETKQLRLRFMKKFGLIRVVYWLPTTKQVVAGLRKASIHFNTWPWDLRNAGEEFFV